MFAEDLAGCVWLFRCYQNAVCGSCGAAVGAGHRPCKQTNPWCEWQAALAADRKTEDGLKESAKFFQEAAGSFAFLRDVACLKVESPRPVDISPECATMLEKLMLAQVTSLVKFALSWGRGAARVTRRPCIQ